MKYFDEISNHMLVSLISKSQSSHIFAKELMHIQKHIKQKEGFFETKQRMHF